MSEISKENVVILLDCSRSMRRKDFSPSRISMLKKFIGEFIEAKNKSDPKDEIALLFFANETKLVFAFSDDYKSKLARLKQDDFYLANVSIDGIFELEQGIQYALTLLSEKIRTIGGQLFRLLLLTDKYHLQMTENLQNLVNTMEGLNISCDICLICSDKVEYNPQIFETITSKTHGEFRCFSTEKMLQKSLKDFTSKKIRSDLVSNVLNQQKKDEGKYLADVAFALRLITPEEVAQINQNGRDSVKCQICFSWKNPLTGFSFIRTGRYCPHCNKPMHLHCAGQWAQKSETAPNVFRCPFCYTLLKISPSVRKGVEIQERMKNPAKFSGKSELDSKSSVKMIRMSMEKLKQTEDVCLYCFEPFGELTEADKIFGCSACGASYHAKCLETMYKESKTCHNCNGKIT